MFFENNFDINDFRVDSSIVIQSDARFVPGAIIWIQFLGLGCRFDNSKAFHTVFGKMQSSMQPPL